MTRIRCSAVLFDMDGVLVDSTPAVVRVWTLWARKHGLPPEEVVRQAHGRPSLATIRELLPDSQDHEAENREVERLEIEDIGDVVALPGARRLSAAGLPTPQHLVTASDLRRGKPFPDPYLKGAALLQIQPADCLVVEDAATGVRSAKTAGARVLGLTTTSGVQELRTAGADWIARDLDLLSLDSSNFQEAISFVLHEPS